MRRTQMYWSNIVQLIAHVLKHTKSAHFCVVTSECARVSYEEENTPSVMLLLLLLFHSMTGDHKCHKNLIFIIYFFSSLLNLKLEIVNGQSGSCLHGFDHAQWYTTYIIAKVIFGSIHFNSKKNLLFEIFNDFRCRLSVCDDLFGNQIPIQLTVTVLNYVNECCLFSLSFISILDLLSINKKSIFFNCSITYW